MQHCLHENYTSMAFEKKIISTGLLKTRRRSHEKDCRKERKTQVRLIRGTPHSASSMMRHKLSIVQKEEEEITNKVISVNAKHALILTKPTYPPEDRSQSSARNDPFTTTSTIMTELSSAPDELTTISRNEPSNSVSRESSSAIDESTTITSDHSQHYRILISHSSSQPKSPRGETTSHALGGTTKEHAEDEEQSFHSNEMCFGVSDEQLTVLLASVIGCAIIVS